MKSHSTIFYPPIFVLSKVFQISLYRSEKFTIVDILKLIIFFSVYLTIIASSCIWEISICTGISHNIRSIAGLLYYFQKSLNAIFITMEVIRTSIFLRVPSRKIVNKIRSKYKILFSLKGFRRANIPKKQTWFYKYFSLQLTAIILKIIYMGITIYLTGDSLRILFAEIFQSIFQMISTFQLTCVLFAISDIQTLINMFLKELKRKLSSGSFYRNEKCIKWKNQTEVILMVYNDTLDLINEFNCYMGSILLCNAIRLMVTLFDDLGESVRFLGENLKEETTPANISMIMDFPQILVRSNFMSLLI